MIENEEKLLTKPQLTWNFDDKMPAISDALVDYIERLPGEAFHQFALDVWDGDEGIASYFGKGQVRSTSMAETLASRLTSEPTKAILQRYAYEPEFTAAVEQSLVSVYDSRFEPVLSNSERTHAVETLSGAFKEIGLEGEVYPVIRYGSSEASRLNNLKCNATHKHIGIYPFAIEAAKSMSSAAPSEIAFVDYLQISDDYTRDSGASAEQYWNTFVAKGVLTDLTEDLSRSTVEQPSTKDEVTAELLVVDTLAIAKFSEPSHIGASTLVFFPADTLRPEFRPEPDDTPTPSM